MPTTDVDRFKFIIQAKHLCLRIRTCDPVNVRGRARNLSIRVTRYSHLLYHVTLPVNLLMTTVVEEVW